MVRLSGDHRLAQVPGPNGPPLAAGGPLDAGRIAQTPETDDPTGDLRLRPLPHLVRKHRDRVVVLVTERCFCQCRFCFRGGQPPRGELLLPEWAEILAWLAGHREVREVILSGGDPLAASDHRLGRIARDLAELPHLERWRIHTRAPVAAPARVTRGLLGALSSRLPLRVIVHANHPAEAQPPFREAVHRLRTVAAVVGNQSVLLAGVNDEAELLAELWERLVESGVRPHYLHHPDPTPENGPFRVTVERGLRIYREARRIDPDAAPPYVIDLPNGAGKCPVADLVPVGEERGPGWRRVRYRWHRPPGWDSLVPDRSVEWWDDRVPGTRS